MDEYVAFAATDQGSVEARVVGLIVDGMPVGVPHNILWWHEIVNLDVGGRRLAVTYCPLTGSPLVVDVTGPLERLNVSGLIFENNLVMFDEGTESLWPQLCLSAVQGPQAGNGLGQTHAVDMRWEEWKTRFPDGLIVSSETGFDREYTRYPLRFYEHSDFLLFPLSQGADTRRDDIKERVFGIGEGPGGVAFPFSELAGTSEGNLLVFTIIGGERVTVLWSGRARAAAAYYPRTTDGRPVTLRAGGRGFTDEETGSLWGVEGYAFEGPLAGSTLALVPESYVAYWFAWAAFHPRTDIWTRE
jgi:hypothetical protein